MHFRFIFFDSLKLLINWIDVESSIEQTIKTFVVLFSIMFLISTTQLLFNFLNVNLQSYYQFMKLNTWIKFKLSKKLFDFSNCLTNWIHSACLSISKKFIIYKVAKLIYCFIVTIIYYNNKKTQTFVKNFINYFRIKYMNI